MTPERIAALAARYPGAVRPSAGPLWATRAAILLFAAAFVWAGQHLGMSFGRLWRGLGDLGVVAAMMIPPTSGGFLRDYLHALGETLAMAFLGTLLASLIALPIGFLGARNVMPVWPLRFGIRRLLDIVRGVDSLVWALIFVSVVGLGPFAGILALALNDSAVLAKLYAEAIEGADRRAGEGVTAAGGGRADVARLAILPQVFPVFLSNSLYFFEANTRSATILGVVGAGGIGFFLADRIRVNAWSDVAFIILLILPTVAVIDWTSGRLRARVIGAPVESGAR